MKPLLLLISLFAYCHLQSVPIDTSGLDSELRKEVEKIIEKKKLSDRLDKEYQKDIAEIKKLKSDLQLIMKNIIKHNKVRKKTDTVLPQDYNAVKQEEYEMYIINDKYRIELVPRNWTGRLFSKYKFKVKIIDYEKND